MLKKVIKTIKKFRLIEPKDKILLAVSGGKDSVSLLYIFKELQEKYDFYFEAYHLNLKIGKFSEKSLEIVEKHCKELNVKLNVEEAKVKPYEVKIEGKSVCGICSIIKRWHIHKFAKENGFNKVATAHTLEDICRFILSFYLDGDILALTRAYPSNKSNVTGITFIKPFYFVSEKEILKFVRKKNLEYVKESCPYSYKKENKNLKILEFIESLKPGAKERIAKNFIKYYKEIGEKVLKELNLRPCKVCGLPTWKEICTFCRLLYGGSGN